MSVVLCILVIIFFCQMGYIRLIRLFRFHYFFIVHALDCLVCLREVCILLIKA